MATLGQDIRLNYLERFVPADGADALVIGSGEAGIDELLRRKGFEVYREAEGDAPSEDHRINLGQLRPADRDRFGLIVASDQLARAADDGALVARCFEILRPGGLLVALSPNGDSQTPLSDRARAQGLHRSNYTEEQLRALIATQPFSDIQYFRTFNLVEETANQLFVDGATEAARLLLRQSTFDGSHGRNHLILARK